MMTTEIPAPPRGCAARTPAERRSVRRYMAELLGSVAAYVALLVVSLETVDRFGPGPVKTAVALLPMLGVLGIAAAVVRFTLRADELQRRTIVTSGAIAGLATGVVSLAIDFLGNAGFPRPGAATTWVVLCAAFGLALPFVSRRYR